MNNDNNALIKGNSDVVKSPKPAWYRDISILIPFVALVFSLFASLNSYVSGAHDDYLASRTELRSLINELMKMNEDFAEITTKYANNPNLISGLSAQYNTKNSILSQQAAAAVGRLENSFFGDKTVLDVEYMAIGQALASSYLYDEALVYYEKAALIATDSATAAGALRAVAGMYMIKGDVETMRAHMSDAADIFSRPQFANVIEFKKRVTNATTYIQWAQGEGSLGNCTQAKENLDSVQQILPLMQESQIKTQLVGQSMFLSGEIAKCWQNSSLSMQYGE